MARSTLDIEAVGVDRDAGIGIVMAPAAVRETNAVVAERRRASTGTGTLADQYPGAGFRRGNDRSGERVRQSRHLDLYGAVEQPRPARNRSAGPAATLTPDAPAPGPRGAVAAAVSEATWVALDPYTGDAGIPGYPCYRTVEETYASARAIAGMYPPLATWTAAGERGIRSMGPAATT